jgi:uncharacterized membrane protein YgaE (UPF0421/DUF939 family)
MEESQEQQEQKKPLSLFSSWSRESMSKQWRLRSPMLLFALKSALAAAFSWGIAALLLGNEGASLAPVSALIVVQVTGWQTVRKSIERILGVLIGVSLSVLAIHFLGVNIWTIFVLIMAAQIAGMLVQKRGQYLATQIPISALLGLVVGTNLIGYPVLRLLGTVIGGLVGTLLSVLLSPPIYVTRAREAIAELTEQIADGTSVLADVLVGKRDEQRQQDIYTRMLSLEGQVRATEQTLSLGFDNTRLNPWAYRVRSQITDYPDILLALNRITRQLRRIAYTINDPSILWDSVTNEWLLWLKEDAQLLRDISQLLSLTADYMPLLHTPVAADTVEDREQKKKEMLALVDTAQQQLLLNEEQFALSKANDQRANDDARVKSVTEPRYHHVTAQGSMLTDIRRILDELRDVLTLLPPTFAYESSQTFHKNRVNKDYEVST